MSQEEEILYVESAPLGPEDERLYQFFQDIQKDSLKTLEDAARQIISLSTSLLGLFFGVLAFKDSPAFLSWDTIRYLGAFSAAALLAGLWFALDVVLPRSLNVPGADLTEMRTRLAGLYGRKSRSLLWSQYAFGAGTLLLLMLILWLLFAS